MNRPRGYTLSAVVSARHPLDPLEQLVGRRQGVDDGGERGDVPREPLDEEESTAGVAHPGYRRMRQACCGQGVGWLPELRRQRDPLSATMKTNPEGRSTMGDKGKKAKDKDQKQKAKKDEQDAKKRLDKQSRGVEK